MTRACSFGNRLFFLLRAFLGTCYLFGSSLVCFSSRGAGKGRFGADIDGYRVWRFFFRERSVLQWQACVPRIARHSAHCVCFPAEIIPWRTSCLHGSVWVRKPDPGNAGGGNDDEITSTIILFNPISVYFFECRLCGFVAFKRARRVCV